VCPERYLKPMVPNSTRFARLQRRRTALSPIALATIQEWDDKGILYRYIYISYHTIKSKHNTGVRYRVTAALQCDSCSQGTQFMHAHAVFAQ
jgi:hypothetical protein